MKVVLTNDDGRPHDEVSPYIKYLVEAIENDTDWDLTICVPSEQKSWIGKAYFADKDLTGSYIYSSISDPFDNSCIGPFSEPQPRYKSDPGLKEWCLVNGTPASCCDIGINHLSDPEEVDLVISGPNVGRNSTALYALSSGTFGGALEACHHNKRSIALSYAYDEYIKDPAILREACRISIKIITNLYEKWNDQVDLYSINVPLRESLRLAETKISWAPMMENRWGSSLFKKSAIKKERDQYKWDPDYDFVHNAIKSSDEVTDGKLVSEGVITITAMKSMFHQIDSLNKGEFTW